MSEVQSAYVYVLYVSSYVCASVFNSHALCAHLQHVKESCMNRMAMERKAKYYRSSDSDRSNARLCVLVDDDDSHINTLLNANVLVEFLVFFSHSILSLVLLIVAVVVVIIVVALFFCVYFSLQFLLKQTMIESIYSRRFVRSWGYKYKRNTNTITKAWVRKGTKRKSCNSDRNRKKANEKNKKNTEKYQMFVVYSHIGWTEMEWGPKKIKMLHNWKRF